MRHIINIKMRHPEARVPTYATSCSGCFDFYSLEDAHVTSSHRFNLGVSMEVPEGHILALFSRSGHGYKNDARLANCVGIIDSDYRGEISAKIRVDGDGELHVQKGDRICQGAIIPVGWCTFIVCDELDETDRGEGGYGSTGK